MANKYHSPKLKIKFMREKSLEDTPIEPGNMIITMDSENVYFDILSASSQAKRINVSDFYSTEQINSLLEGYYTKSQIDGILAGGEDLLSIANTDLGNLTEEGEKKFPIKPYNKYDTYKKGDIVVFLDENDKINFGVSLQNKNIGHTFTENEWWNTTAQIYKRTTPAQAVQAVMPDYNAGISWTTTKGNIWTAPYNCYLNASLDQGSKFVVRKDSSTGAYLTYQWNDLGQTNSNNLIIPKGLKLYVAEFLMAHESSVTIYPFMGDDNA